MKAVLQASAIAATVLAGMAAQAVFAKSQDVEPPGRAAVVRALSDCRKITDDAGRLACYDKAAGALDQAESQGQVLVIDQEQAKAVRRQAFGFNLPTLHIFDRTARSEDGVDHLTLDLDGAHRGVEGHWVFVAADGAVWRQTDSTEFGEDPHKGSTLLVKHGALGSFFCKVDRQPQVRCQRVS